MPTTATTILERLIEPEPNELTPEAARYFLGLELRPADRQRLQQLADKAQSGMLTAEERTELQEFERANDLLSRVKFKARKVLAGTTPESTSSTASPPTEEAPTVGAGIPPGILRSQQAFWRDLPELLKNNGNRGKWVAYHGNERIGIARTEVELIRECIQRGLRDDEYDLDVIEPRSVPPWEGEVIEPGGHQADDVEDAEHAGNTGDSA